LVIEALVTRGIDQSLGSASYYRLAMPKTSSRRKIAVITTSRSDYAHLRWLLHDLSRHPKVHLQVIALGPHLAPEFGLTGREVIGHVTTVECLLSSDTDVGMAKTLGVATLGLADVLGRMRPDLLLLIADRYEMLAPANVALTLRIPIAHIEGGELSGGAIDDSVRNAITKMAHLHFACTRTARERVIAIGEAAWRVKFSGSLSLDNLKRSKLLTGAQLQTKLGVKLKPDFILAIYHPVTMKDDSLEEAGELFAALQNMDRQILFIYPNADAGSHRLIAMTEKFVADHRDAEVFVNLDHTTYLSLLSQASLLVGNSSSGIIESTSVKTPALNIGIRQRGREHAANVLDVPADREAILKAIRNAKSPSFRKLIQQLTNPYGKGEASEAIVKVLTETPLGERLLFKA
jgi:UDP-hydrolysing UDP-N-acetyl-D-glucosamine 2-epimerase